MASQTVQWTYGRFESLVNGSNQTLLVFLKSLGLAKGDVVTFEEVAAGPVATGRYAKGTIETIWAGEFYNLPKTENLYYFSPMQRMPWIDISATSAIVGWSAFTTKQIWYQVVGDSVIVRFDLRGTSNSVNSNFTVPLAQVADGITTINACFVRNNGVTQASPGRVSVNSGAGTIDGFLNMTNAAWTNTGNKFFIGEIIYRWR